MRTVLSSWTTTSLVAFVFAAGVTFGAESPRSSPEEERATLQAADGFEIQLFAADPAIAKPIQMNFDNRGRLWVVSSESYPQLEPGAEPRDKVFVLEDKDGDGVAERSTLFADGLLLPTGIEIGDGGVYVGQSTEVLHLRDTDGDGRADRSRVVLSGFGTEDTHHLIHTFRWGPGGTLHFGQSIYIHSHVETPWGVRRLNGGGFWMFRPESYRLSVLVHGMVNSWGIAFDRFGQSFGVDNDSGESSIKYFLPGARLKHTPGESHILTGIVQGKPKYCGAEFVTGRHFPDDWQGNLITCDFRAHRVCRYAIGDDGAGYRADELEPLITSGNAAFRPIDVKMGPDGALYVCDFYNPIINHGEVDFRDPRRDKTHGRIWRVVAKDRPLVERPKLANATIDALLDSQNAPEGWTRHFARRTLAERPKKDVLASLNRWSDAQEDELSRLRALWIHETIDEPNDALLANLLSAKDPKVRAAAVRVASHRIDRLENSLDLLAPRVVDEHPRVRMEAVRALAPIRDPQAMRIALRALDQPMDKWLDYALKLTARETAPVWLASLDGGRAVDAESASRWVHALLALDAPSAAGPLLEIWRRGLAPAEEADAILDAVARNGAADQLSVVFEALSDLEGQTTAPQRIRLMRALATANRLRGVRPNGALAERLSRLFADKNPEVRREAVRLAAQWKLQPLQARIAELATDDDTDRELRSTAIEALGTFGDAASTKVLRKLAGDATHDDRRLQALRSLVALDAAGAARFAEPILAEAKDAAGATSLFDAFLRHKSGPAALAAALRSATLAKEVAAEGVRVANASGQVAPDLIAVLVKAGSLPETTRALSPAQMKRMVAAVQRTGAAKRGAEIFGREKLACVKCHRIKEKGGKVGPDLSSIGASAPVDYLIESMLLPDAKIKENFHTVVVGTTDGKILTGIPVRKSDDELVLRDAEDKLISIPTADIETSRTGGSIMPANVAESLTSQEIIDLVRYLSELGKPGPYGPDTELTNRRWRLLGPLTEAEAKPIAQRLIDAGAKLAQTPVDWQSSLTTNAGWVYLREYGLNPQRPVFFAASTVRVEKPGKIRLAIQPPRSADVWFDGRPIKPTRVADQQMLFDLDFEAGDHPLLLRINLSGQRRPDGSVDPGSVPRILKLTGYPLDGVSAFEFVTEGG